MSPVIEQETAPITAPRQARHFQADEIARDLALMDEFEAFAHSLPNRRVEAGLGPLPDNAVALVYEEREAKTL